MNPVTLGEDVRFHTRIPLVCTVPKMDAALKQGLHWNNSHVSPNFLPFSHAWQPEPARNGMSLVGMQLKEPDPLKDAYCPSQARYVALSRHGKIISQNFSCPREEHSLATKQFPVLQNTTSPASTLAKAMPSLTANGSERRVTNPSYTTAP
jgi:hypothetical protein